MKTNQTTTSSPSLDYTQFPKSHEFISYEIPTPSEQDILAYYNDNTKKLAIEYLDESYIEFDMSEVEDYYLLFEITQVLTDLYSEPEFEKRLRANCNISLFWNDKRFLWNLGMSQLCFFHLQWDKDRFLNWSENACRLLEGDITSEVYDSISF